MDKEQLDKLKNRLEYYLGGQFQTKLCDASNEQIYYAMASLTNELLLDKRAKFFGEKQKKNKKTLHYISIEFLIGKSLKNNIWNLGIESELSKIISSSGKNIEDIYGVETDAGLGNGGLGRLASCYLESLAKCGYNAFGHSILYEYGLFKQKIVDGTQVQEPDKWFENGRVWFNRNDVDTVFVKFGGRVIQHYDEPRGLSYEMVDQRVVKAIPYDYYVPALGTDNTATIRFWQAQAENGIDLRLFDVGEFESSLKNEVVASEINKVLYPNDNNQNGQDLRLIQQYFLVSAVAQSVLQNYFKTNSDLKNFSKMLAVHINDTHPTLIIPELMRLLIDEYGYGWDESWQAVSTAVSYTNHTILSEALEIKNMSAIERIIPRLALILREIDRRFRIELSEFFKNDYKKIEKLAVISGDKVYMANLAVCASYAVNGVAKIHSEILKSNLFSSFYQMMPNKFLNITNGISFRRWLSQSNPELNDFIVSLIGDEFYDDAKKLKLLEKFENDKSVLDKIGEIKFENKIRLSNFVKKNFDIDIDPNARFDVQAKRIHEYKRQLMNIMKVIYLAEKIRNNPTEKVTNQVFIFAGKAASGYAMAKRIIELISSVQKEINSDPIFDGKLKVVFLENYNVSLSEILMPATEVSEQISVAGREASGTGNMKAVVNGAVMLCTIDGANIEIYEQTKRENSFVFGLTSDEVQKISRSGYNAIEYYEKSEKIRIVISKLKNGIGGKKYEDIASYLLGYSGMRDIYMCLADFDDYVDEYYKMDRVYKQKDEWNKRSLHSIANMGYFSSDRSIKDYADKIWKLKPVK